MFHHRVPAPYDDLCSLQLCNDNIFAEATVYRPLSHFLPVSLTLCPSLLDVIHVACMMLIDSDWWTTQMISEILQAPLSQSHVCIQFTTLGLPLMFSLLFLSAFQSAYRGSPVSIHIIAEPFLLLLNGMIWFWVVGILRFSVCYSCLVHSIHMHCMMFHYRQPWNSNW